MENEKSLTGLESLEVISKMIKAAQNDLEDDSFYYLIWGWMVFLASVGNYVLIKMDSAYASLTWAVLMPLGGILTWIYSAKSHKEKKVKTYLDDIMKYVVIAFVTSLFLVLFFMSKLGLSTYAMVLVVYGAWLFISGGVIKFKPLMIGGAVNWILSIPMLFTTFENQLLLLAAAVLLGYIVPGYMLKSRYNKSQERVAN